MNSTANCTIRQGAALVSTGGALDQAHPVLTICDGRGGTLVLDLASPHLGWLVDAIGRLVSDQLPAGACLLKVFAAEQVYLLRRSTTAKGETEVQVTNLFDPAEQVVLSALLAEIVASLGEEALRRRRMFARGKEEKGTSLSLL